MSSQRGGALLLCVLLAVTALAGCRSRAEVGGGSTPSSGTSRSEATPPTSSAGTHNPAARTTRMITFSPFSSDGRLTARVRPAGSGSCFSTSISTPVPHAYRCFQDNEILDPCFASPAEAQAGSVVCFADPWATGRRVTLTKPLPDGISVPHPKPWALELANGARCIAVTGTVQTVHGQPLSYQCRRHTAAGLETGAGTLLRARYGSVPDGPLHTVAVKTAWTG